MTEVLLVSYGGGVNSTAMLIGMVERDIRPHAILFADTGGEKRETYSYLRRFDYWLTVRNMPRIVIVQNDGQYRTLEKNCLDTQCLPSPAYGGRSCSDKYKKRPQEKWAKQDAQCQRVWEAGGKVTKALGISTEESHRAIKPADKLYEYTHPLLDWDWDRDDCVRAIERAGLPVPPKSACFYCPSSKKWEVRWLAKNHPDLFARALAMEENATNREHLTVKGLGRHWSWKDIAEADRRQLKLFPEPADEPCMWCMD